MLFSLYIFQDVLMNFFFVFLEMQFVFLKTDFLCEDGVMWSLGTFSCQSKGIYQKDRIFIAKSFKIRNI